MRLIALECDQLSFTPIRFRRGLTLIKGTSSGATDDGTSNGVGKTLAVALLHHCLGGNADPRLKRAVPKWMFSLRFELGDSTHTITRSGDGKQTFWDGAKISMKALRARLNADGPFELPKIDGVTFRSLFTRFARHLREDCVAPERTHKEQDHQALLRTLYLLGLDVSLVARKADIKAQMDTLSDRIRLLEAETAVADLLRAGTNPKVRLTWLQGEVEAFRQRLGALRVAEDYRRIEVEAGELTTKLRRLQREIAVLDFQLDGIDKSLERAPALSREDLLRFYEGLERAFKPEALRHFAAVEAFQEQLARGRRERLTRERLRLAADKTEKEHDRRATGAERDALLGRLRGKTALDEYASVAKQLAKYEEELAGLQGFLERKEQLEAQRLELSHRLVDEDGLAAEYLRTAPMASIDAAFRETARRLYPRHAAGIVIESNTGKNKLRYDLSVELQGDSSDGINDARILCFDWVLLTRGAHHTMDFLWHDNRLFADIDPQQRARWFTFLLKELPAIGKDYVATINSENLDAMRPYLADDVWDALQDAVVVSLSGDSPANKLLGIQFAGS